MAEIVVDEEVGAVPERLRVYIIIYYIIMYYILIIYYGPRAAARGAGCARHRYIRVHHCILYHHIVTAAARGGARARVNMRTYCNALHCIAQYNTLQYIRNTL